MAHTPVTGAFGWYDTSLPHACPPKSLFVILFLLILGMALPAVGLWLSGFYLALQWLIAMAMLSLLGLLIDVLLTYRRYKNWGDEWLCGECRGVFKPSVA